MKFQTMSKKKLRFAFLSRHEPTSDQFALAADNGIELVPIGDMDAFAVTPVDIFDLGLGHFDGVVVVHPAAAMRLCGTYAIGVFENASRARAGEKPVFEAKALHLFDAR